MYSDADTCLLAAEIILILLILYHFLVGIKLLTLIDELSPQMSIVRIKVEQLVNEHMLTAVGIKICVHLYVCDLICDTGLMGVNC